MALPRIACSLLGLVLVGCGPAGGRDGLEPLDLAGTDGVIGGPDFAPTDFPRIQSDLPMDDQGPIITITSPLAGALVAGRTLTVTAKVVPRPMQKDVRLVTVEGPPLPNNKPAPMAEMVRTQMADEYRGSIDISATESGPLDVAVIAEDLSGLRSSAKITYARDAGPKIHVFAPKNQSYRGSAPVLFTVEDKSYMVDVAATRATIQQVPIPIKQVQGQSPPTWNGTIDFYDPKFKAPLFGEQAMRLVAKNINGTTTEADVSFSVDEQGPTIVFLKPLPGDYVGGVLTIQAQIDDPSGVADNSVVAVIPDVDQMNGMNVDRVVQLVREGNMMMSTNRFSGVFDTKQLHPNFVYSNISVRASDVLDNSSQVAEQVIVDNTQPAIDLDPPRTRVKRILSGKTYECSRDFDPVGDEAANDGDVQNQVIWLKARAEDRGNTGIGLVVENPSTIVPATVELYMIRASDGPLLVDTNGDTFCDEVNPDLKPAVMVNQPKQALVVTMAPLLAGGLPDYRFENSPPPPGCGVIGDNGAIEPTPSCQVTSLSYTMVYTVAKIPIIWSIPPIVLNAVQCQGLQLDVLNKIPDGPVCVTVRAKDVAGNVNVARPLRLCIDKFGKNTCDLNVYRRHGDPPAAGVANLPNCTGTVDKMGVVNATPCKPGLKLNTGVSVSAYPMPNEPYVSE